MYFLTFDPHGGTNEHDYNPMIAALAEIRAEKIANRVWKFIRPDGDGTCASWVAHFQRHLHPTDRLIISLVGDHHAYNPMMNPASWDLRPEGQG